MPYMGDRIEGNAEVRKYVENRFFLRTRNIPESVLERAEALQWEHSSFSDPGPDWNRAHFIDADGEACLVVKIDGD